jgi:PhzF family phenazine biosynthesis protein
MKIKLFQVDAFTNKLFRGNPAAVCITEKWIDEHLMQKIAMENNLSETAFIVKKNNQYQIRWFTPKIEVDLCGHATLASAHVIFNHYDYESDEISFNSIYSGKLIATRNGEYITLDFPVDKLNKVKPPNGLVNSIGKKPFEVYKGKEDYLLIYNGRDDIQNLSPDFNKLKNINTRGIIVTAKDDKYDFVSRFFAPALGINEDPVTGSAHTLLIPYWANKLNKNELIAKQLSKRSGILKCKFAADRVYISGKAKTFFIGEISI